MKNNGMNFMDELPSLVGSSEPNRGAVLVQRWGEKGGGVDFISICM